MDDGRRVAGRYHLLEPIGRGGMGVVWRAHDELLDRAVAVKEVLYHPTSEEDRETFNRRTIREARAAGRITHPNVVVVHDVIEEDGRPWIVMQLVRARSLGEVLHEHGPLVPERVASIGLQVLDALCTAHAAGVLHRDVKPENVLLSGDNRVVLTDFGIATMPEETGLTMTGSISGTPAFLPPERLNGLPATPESDLWSLGATLYAAVEGRPPFDRNSPIATMAAVLHDEPEPPRRAGALTPVLEGLLRKDPAQRIDAVEASELLNAALAGPASGLGVAGAPGGTGPRLPEGYVTAPSQGREPGSIPAPTFPPGAHAAQPSPWQHGTGGSAAPGGGIGGERPGRRSSTRVVLLVLLPLLLVGVGVGGWYGYRTLVAGPSPSASPSSPPSQPVSTPPATDASTPASPTPTSSASPTPSPSASSSSESPSTSPSPSGSSGAGNLPKGWAMRTDKLGFSIALPPGWTAYSREAARVRFRGPGMPGYLQIDLTPWTDADPVSALITVEATSTKKGYLPGYERVRLDPQRYLGVPAADWEFTFTPSYGKVRVIDRAFQLPDGRCFAIYWQVPDAHWTAGLSYFQTFTSTFRPR